MVRIRRNENCRVRHEPRRTGVMRQKNYISRILTAKRRKRHKRDFNNEETKNHEEEGGHPGDG